MLASVLRAGTIVAVLIVLALVFYLVSTILQLRTITAGLDEVIASVGEILQKSAPVNAVVTTINPTSTPASTCSRGCSSRRRGWRTPSG